jgi:hypothetical protein
MEPVRKKFIADVLRTAAALVEEGVITQFDVIEMPGSGGGKTMKITLETGKLLRSATVPLLPTTPAQALAGKTLERTPVAFDAPTTPTIVLDKDGWRCRICGSGEPWTGSTMTISHACPGKKGYYTTDGVPDAETLRRNQGQYPGPVMPGPVMVPPRDYHPCSHVFRDSGCGYTGGLVWCDKTFQRCRELGNTVHFNGCPSEYGRPP